MIGMAVGHDSAGDTAGKITTAMLNEFLLGDD